MKELFFFILILFIFSIKSEIDTSKMIIIYYSRTGNTELFFNYIKELINIDSYKIEPLNPYPIDSDIMHELARIEYKAKSRPEIKDPLTNVTKYKKILLGYPLWNSHLPNIIITQLLKLNLLGKTIYPFNTDGSSGVGNSITDIKLHSVGAIIKKGIDIKASMIKDKEYSIKIIKKWLKDNFGYEYESEKILKFKLIIIIIYFLFF